MTVEQKQIAGIDVQITRRKNMRTTRLRVKGDGSVVVSTACSTPKRTIVKIVEDNLEWIATQQQAVRLSPMHRADNATDAEKREWRAVVEAGTKLLLEQWEPIIGVRVKKLAFRSMKSRWGSCQPATGRVCINTRLALYPARCLEYVVVHELVHMLEPSHNARFHALMTGFLPDWKETRKLLR